MKIFEVVLRLNRGGLLFLPFPAENQEEAEKLSERAEEIFGGQKLQLKFAGDIKGKYEKTNHKKREE